MSDLQTALKGASFEGTVTVADAGLTGMITVRGDIATIMAAAAKETGVAVPETRGVTQSGDFGIAWMSTDEILVLCPYDQAVDLTTKLSTALDGEHALAVNVSDARALISVTGEPAALRETIAKLAPVDLALDRFAVGEMRRTRFAQVAAAFWLMSESEARVICFRSVGEYVFNLLKTSAKSGGEVGVF